ncbi:MAG: hypothetical protein ACD_15C00144G0002, partial [uncultured bacterium]
MKKPYSASHAVFSLPGLFDISDVVDEDGGADLGDGSV